ncbi:oligosaccharide flippase family protein [Candidatus Woesebacteria bacterium]|nr:oligosaccharide flippase family protein [Candidatus Woesebacteria bacterium]
MSYSVKRSAVLNLTSYIYLFIASLATTPTLIRYLGLTNFGTYVLSLGVLALVTSVDLGLSRSVVYQLARSNKTVLTKQILSTSLLLHTTLGTLFSLATLIWFSPYLSFLIFYTFILGHYQAYHESQGNFGMVNLRAFVIGTTNTLVAAFLAYLGYGVFGILISLSASTLFTILVMAMYTPASITKHLSMPVAKKIIKYGLKLQVGKLVNSLQAQYPKLIFASNAVALTVLSLSSSLIAKAAGAVSQLAIAIFPYSINSQDKSKLRRYYTYSQLSLLALGIIAIYLYSYFGYSILYWWLGDMELASNLHTFLLTYRYYGLLLVLTPLASTMLDSHNMAGRSSLYALLALVIELAVVSLTYSGYGVMSIAYGSVTSLLVMVPVLLITTQKSVSLDDN